MRLGFQSQAVIEDGASYQVQELFNGWIVKINDPSQVNNAILKKECDRWLGHGTSKII